MSQPFQSKSVPLVPLALRPRDAAKALGICERTLWQLTKDGHDSLVSGWAQANAVQCSILLACCKHGSTIPLRCNLNQVTMRRCPMGKSTTIRDAATRPTISKVMFPVPINPGTKKCTFPGWGQGCDWKPSISTNTSPIGCEKGIGILNGEPSGGLIDVDLGLSRSVSCCGSSASTDGTDLGPTERVKQSQWLSCRCTAEPCCDQFQRSGW